MIATGLVALGSATAGFASSFMPGPCNVAVVDSSLRGSPLTHSLAIGLGGALGDMVFATLAATGAGAVLGRHPVVPVLFDVIGGILLVVVGLTHLLGGPRTASLATTCRHSRGLAIGLSLVLANPAVLATWTLVIVGLAGDAHSLTRGFAVLAIGAGSFAGFAVVAQLSRRGRSLTAERRARVRGALGLVLVVLGYVAWTRAFLGAARMLG